MIQKLTRRNSAEYRDAARKLYAPKGGITIANQAAVQHVEDGAFVEAIVWVPNTALTEKV